MDFHKNWHPTFPPNLQNCHEEPIRIPGAIQSFGVLLAYDGAGIIQAHSENASEIFPQLADGPKGLKLSSLVHIHEPSYISTPLDLRGKRLVDVTLVGSEQSLHGATYFTGGVHVLEVETTERKALPGTIAYLADLPLMMQDIRHQATIENLAHFTAEKVKAMTGFDRVMIYKFDEKWDGAVIAESREPKLETFLGLHFPASDIPPQARALYERNWIRIIPTVNYRPSRILPEKHQALDLSDSVLRSVSPIHIQYLRNMGVTASMSISLIVDGKLWGLIACHHYSGEHLVPLDVRFGCEAYAQLISWHIKTLEAAETVRMVSEGEGRLHRVLQAFGDFPDFRQAARAIERDLLTLFDCDGLVIRLGSEAVTLGALPDHGYLNSIARALEGRTIFEPIVTNEASAETALPQMLPNPMAAGLMALALAPQYNYFIACVRREVKETVTWAGNPGKKLNTNFEDPAQRLIPRGSFELWKETNDRKSMPWSPTTVDLLKRFGLLFVKIVIERKELVEKSNTELRTLNQSKDEFVAMVSHELRTPLNAIIGWTELALSGDLESAQFPDALKIIQRNARSQNQLISDLLDVSRIISGKMKLSVKNMRVTEVVEAVALSFMPAADAKSIKIVTHYNQDSDSIIGDPGRVQQVVWNLLSNAMKFSTKNSQIWITVRRVNSQVELEVKDQGAGLEPNDLDKIFGRFQQVDSSTTRKAGGLGLGLAISKHIVEMHGGKIEARSEGINKGASFVVTFPISPVRPETESGQLPIDDEFKSNAEGISVHSSRLKGETVLIVEDEYDASTFLNLLIKAHGARTFTAANGREALEVLKNHGKEVSVVLSDVGMPEMDGHQLAQAIRSSEEDHIRNICMIALTAFGRPGDRITALKSGFDTYIAKPVMQEELLTVLESACKKKSRESV